MPQMDGFETFKEIRKEPDLKDTPIIMLTALSDPQNMEKAISIGAIDYIEKPFDIDKLLFKVDLYLREGSVPNPVSPQDSLAMKEEREQLSMREWD